MAGGEQGAAAGGAQGVEPALVLDPHAFAQIRGREVAQAQEFDQAHAQLRVDATGQLPQLPVVEFGEGVAQVLQDDGAAQAQHLAGETAQAPARRGEPGARQQTGRAAHDAERRVFDRPTQALGRRRHGPTSR